MVVYFIDMVTVFTLSIQGSCCGRIRSISSARQVAVSVPSSLPSLLHSFSKPLPSACGVPGTVHGMENKKSDSLCQIPTSSLNALVWSLGFCWSNHLGKCIFMGPEKYLSDLASLCTGHSPALIFLRSFLELCVPLELAGIVWLAATSI